jgi:hypothetical protein
MNMWCPERYDATPVECREARMFRATQTDERPGLFGRFGRWFQDWSRRRKRLAELASCGPAEVEHMARDLGMSRGELSVLAGKWPDSADLLSRRLEQVNLAGVEPQVLRDLERVCTLCGSKRKCEYDLTIHPSHPAWTGYCPNAPTISALMSERSARRAAKGT